MKATILLILTLTFLIGCQSNIDSVVYLKFQQKGNKISNEAQITLLSNVGKAIQNGGTESAVEFCNLNANSIIDSLNQEFSCTISRISEKNRNPEAGLRQNLEEELWSIFMKGTLTDTLIQEKNGLVFYKSISISIPTCLKCHGNTDSDITTATFQKFNELYPQDQATGYKLNDLRGLWKIDFARN